MNVISWLGLWTAGQLTVALEMLIQFCLNSSESSACSRHHVDSVYSVGSKDL